MSEEFKPYPEEVGIVGFKDGTYDCYPRDADIPPSVKYIRYDLVDSLRQEVERLNGLYGIIDGQKVIISELEAEIKILRSKANDSER